MKGFSLRCDQCGNLVFFENVQCVRCNHALGFLPDAIDLSTLEATGEGQWRALTPAARDRVYKQCANGQQHQVCNWLVPAEDSSSFCLACRLNDVIPDLTVANHRELWHKLEVAKRRVIYTLLRLRLSTEGAPSENRPPLRFRF